MPIPVTDIPIGSDGRVISNENFLAVRQGAHAFPIEDRDLTAPPGGESEGQAWIVGAAATGDWATHDGEIAYFKGGGYVFITVTEGMVAWIADEDVFLAYDGAAWVSVGFAGTFLALTDAPAAYAGQAGKAVLVNGAEDGVEFGVAVSTLLGLTDTPGAYAGGDAGKAVVVNATEDGVEFGAFAPSAGVEISHRGALVKLSGDQSITTGAFRTVAWDAAEYDTKYNRLKIWLGPDGTFTADDTTEELTFTAHGMVTGDGPFQVSSDTTLPAGLVAATNYWAIVTGVNTFKVATSYANAVADTAVDITDTGTGIHTLERETRLVVPFGATKVKVADNLRFGASVTGEIAGKIVKNGADFAGQPYRDTETAAEDQIGGESATVVVIGGTDYFQVQADVGTTRDLAAHAATWFSMEIVETDEALFPAADLSFFNGGLPLTSAKLGKHTASRRFELSDDFAGSVAHADVAATASTVFDVQRNGVSIGSVTFAAAATVATFATTGGSVEAFEIGDRLTLVAPGTQDATLADISFSFQGTRG